MQLSLHLNPAVSSHQWVKVPIAQLVQQNVLCCKPHKQNTYLNGLYIPKRLRDRVGAKGGGGGEE